MNSEEKDRSIQPVGKRFPPWRSSLYEEPAWVSLAWIVVPAALAGLGIFLAMR